MDIRLIKILDIPTKIDDETGNVIETKKVYVPSVMSIKDIEEIGPGITTKGKLYKNISMIGKYSGENQIVVGNYNDIVNMINKDKVRYKIGYDNYE